MLYPENIEEKIGFDKVRELIKAECSGALGTSFVDKIRFSFKLDTIDKLTAQTTEFQQILIQADGFPQGGYVDVDPILRKIRIIGAFLLEEEAHDLKLSFITIGDVLKFFAEEERKLAYPQLNELAENVDFDLNLIRAIDLVVDERGKIRSNASPELARIRRQMHNCEQGLRSKLDTLLKSFKKEGYTKDDASHTIRDGRLVIPVAAEYKRKIKGFVHDASATGQTVYLEPQEVLDMNNEVRELQLDEQQEIVRILSKLTDKIRPHIESLKQANFFLGMMDFIRAKARFSNKIDGIKPEIVDEPMAEWYYATHPLLFLAHKEQGKKVIPQTILLEKENRILVISGPNAGGKSIALKTVALLQYMFQCGLPIPVAEASKVGIFKNMFIDIGDEQSIENDLSTYSSHLTNMKNFLEGANKFSLCLIDEFGTGTEPKLGAAIAESILEQINHKKAFGVITTHYANLKFFADRTHGLINGAMRYDVDNLQPLYELEIGQPGSSFALEIAQKIGLPQEIINRARNKVGKKEINIERLLGQLEMEKKELEDRNFQLERQQQKLENTLLDYTEKKDYFEENKKKILNEAKAEASKLMEQANRKIEMAIKSVKTHKGDKIITKQVKHEIEAFKKELKPELVDLSKIVEEEEMKYKVIGGVISIGDFVKVIGQETTGEVLEIGQKDALVSIGQLKSNIKLKRLEKISKRKAKEISKAPQSKGVNVSEKLMKFSLKLDLRGKRAEEVLSIVDDFIDNAIMFNQRNIEIVHGKGTGALREVVRNQLRQFPEIQSYKDGHADRGGSGVTMVEMK